jgi:taurine dioxygenase
MKAVPVSGALGAELHDIDPRHLSPIGVDELLGLVHEHGVVFLPGANLSEDEHMALGQALGEVAIFPFHQLVNATEPAFQVIADGPASPPEADYWHTDVTWTQVPPAYALLAAEVMPERGGDTLWASTTAAFDALSPAMQEFLRGKTVVHDNTSFIKGFEKKVAPSPERDELARRLAQTFPPVRHPLIRTHPVTGKEILFLGGRFMRRIVELTEAESDDLLTFLTRHIDNPAFHCRWRWTPGDLAIWDERSTNHRNAADYFPQVRRIRRIEIVGEQPFYRSAVA